MRTTTSAALAAALVGLAACSGPPWKTYPFQDKGFIASFPAKPIVKDFPAEPSHAATTMIDAATDQGEFTVAVIDGSASDKPADQVLSEVPDAMAKSTPQGGTVRLLTYTAVMAGPTAIMGRDFQIERPGQPALRARVYVYNKRLYETVAVSPKGPTDPVVVKFLDSFLLLVK